MNKTLTKIVLAIVIFCVSAGAYYYPVHKKGYPIYGDYLNLVEARNYAASGTYMTEDANGAYLSSQNAKLRGVVTGIPNPLTPIIYGRIFKYFGFNINLPSYVSIVLFSLFNALLFLLISRLFSVKVGFIAGISSALTPVMVVGAVVAGFYEWAMLFFIGALWLFLGSKNGPFKAGFVRIFFASILFALSALARNAFAVSFIPFFLYDFYLSRSVKRGLLFLLPFLVIFGSTLTPYSWLGVPNGYGSTNPPFNEAGHLFRDPYSYHFEKDAYIASNFPQGAYTNRYGTQFLEKYGYPTNLKSQIGAYFESAKIYVTNFFPIINIGGPLVLALIFYGAWLLRKKNPQLLALFCLWPVIWFLLLVSRQTGNWDHYIELIFPIVTLSSLGLFELFKMIKNALGPKVGRCVATGLFLLFILHLGQADKWRLFDDYRSSINALVINFVNSPDFKNIKGPIAVYIHQNVAFTLNYYSDREVVYFDSQTVEENLKAGKLKNIFAIYGIKAAFGYSSDLSSQIKSTLKIPVFPYDKK
ncbi:MAG: hypothetical protein AAB792_02175 [Patescibacteria group bacterium]